jgi:hypothetical protein
MNMSNKSLFEKLFEEVMQDDAEALGLPSGEGSEGAGEMGGEDFGSEEGGDEVTLTLDRETAQKLHDLLGGILGGGEETEDEGMGEEDGMEDMGEEGEEDMGDEAAEDTQEDDEDPDEDEAMHEAPQSKYETFETKGKAEQLQKQSNSRVQGAVANKTSAHGKAEKTSQTPGTEHYMPFTKKVDQAKPGGSIKVNNPKYNPNGKGDSIFG